MNNSNSSSDDDTCSTVSFRNEDMMADFMLPENREMSSSTGLAAAVEQEEEWSDKECRYLAQMSDPRFMTARQRSLLDKRSGACGGASVEEANIDQLPSRDTARSQRQIGKAGEHRRAVRERQQEEQRATVERLLKVTPGGSRVAKRARGAPSSLVDSDAASSRLASAGPSVRIVSTRRPGCASYVAFSDADSCPHWPTPTPPPPTALCSLPGCNNRRRYSCARTGKALCSLRCYKDNLTTAS